MREYVVTETAGSHVAGKRASEGDVLTLTDRQAAHELRLGSIRKVGKAKAKADEAK